MKNLVFLLLMVIVVLTSCNTQSNKKSLGDNPKSELVIKTLTSVDGVKSEIISDYNGDYFEARLCLYPNGEYGVENNLQAEKIDGVIHIRKSQLIDGNTNKQIRFKSPTDFLNYLSSKNYEMITQKKGRYDIDYTFKRKI